MTDRLARVAEIRAFPVKSLQADGLTEGHVTPTGLRGDRTWAVVDPTGEVVSARQEDRLRQVRAVVGDDGDVRLEVPGKGSGLSGAAAEQALSDFLGRPVALRRSEERYLDVAAVHLVSRQAVEASTVAEQHADGQDHDDSCPCSVEEPRANLVLDLDADGASEQDWVGREVVVGDAVLRVTRSPRHCLGVYAEVVREGAVRLGDPVTLPG